MSKLTLFSTFHNSFVHLCISWSRFAHVGTAIWQAHKMVVSGRRALWILCGLCESCSAFLCYGFSGFVCIAADCSHVKEWHAAVWLYLVGAACSNSQYLYRGSLPRIIHYATGYSKCMYYVCDWCIVVWHLCYCCCCCYCTLFWCYVSVP